MIDYTWQVMLALTIGLTAGVHIGFMVVLGSIVFDKKMPKRHLIACALTCLFVGLIAGLWFGWNGGAHAMLERCL